MKTKVWYEAGLQAGKKAAETVDAFIGEEFERMRNFVPIDRKRMPDGSVVYQWVLDYDLRRQKGREGLIKVLHKLDGLGKEDAYAYKLAVADNLGGSYVICNSQGEALFTELRIIRGVAYPDEWYAGCHVPASSLDWSNMKFAGLEGLANWDTRPSMDWSRAKKITGLEILAAWDTKPSPD